jgi:hypothetical protein
MSNEVTSPFTVFFDRSGQPLDNGYIYIGTAGINPEVSPIALYWDETLTTPAAQPIRTLAGYPSRFGSPGTIFIGQTNYSIVVRDRNGALVFSSLNISTSEESLLNIAALQASLYQPSTGPKVVAISYKTTLGDGPDLYYLDASDTSTADDGKTVIVTAGGARYKTRRTAFTQLMQNYTDALAADYRRYTFGSTHTGTPWVAQGIDLTGVGSGGNGPANGNFGIVIAAIRDDFLTATTGNELDPFFSIVRNGGGNLSDSSCFLGNAGTRDSFTCFSECQTVGVDALNAVTHDVRTQIGVVDKATGDELGFYASSNVGVNNRVGLLLGSSSGSNWANYVELVGNDGILDFRISDGGATIWYQAGTAAGFWYVINNGGVWSLLNSAATVVMSVSGGTVESVGAFKAPVYQDGAGTQVVTTRQAAITNPTGGATIDAEARTAIGSILTAMRTHGLIAT